MVGGATMHSTTMNGMVVIMNGVIMRMKRTYCHRRSQTCKSTFAHVAGSGERGGEGRTGGAGVTRGSIGVQPRTACGAAARASSVLGSVDCNAAAGAWREHGAHEPAPGPHAATMHTRGGTLAVQTYSLYCSPWVDTAWTRSSADTHSATAALTADMPSSAAVAYPS